MFIRHISKTQVVRVAGGHCVLSSLKSQEITDG